LVLFLFAVACESAYALVGRTASDRAFPFVVRVRSDQGMCSGIAHVNGLILTSAHCVWDAAGGWKKNVRIVFKDVDGIDRTVRARKILIPPEFQAASMLQTDQSPVGLQLAYTRKSLYDLAYIVPDGLVQTLGYIHFLTDILPASDLDVLAEMKWQCDLFHCRSTALSEDFLSRLHGTIASTVGKWSTARFAAAGYGGYCENARKVGCHDDRLRILDDRLTGLALLSSERPSCNVSPNGFCIHDDGLRLAPWIWRTRRTDTFSLGGADKAALDDVEPVQPGDSGGPLFVRAKDGRLLLIGIHSSSSEQESVATSILANVNLIRRASKERIWSPGDPGWQGSYRRFFTEQISEFVDDYFETWSHSDNAVALGALARFYSSSTKYGGKITSPESIVADKRKFIDRWPIRRFAIRPDETTIWCTARDVDPCFVKANVQWTIWPLDAGVGFSGISRYEFEILPTDRGERRLPKITGEDGYVLKRFGRDCPFCSNR
jgi:hypothetical protein